MSQTVANQTRTARKPHRCAYCNGTIPVGQKHRVWTWADCGRIYRDRGHEACIELYSLLGWDSEDLWDSDEFRQYCREELPGHAPYPWEANPPENADG